MQYTHKHFLDQVYEVDNELNRMRRIRKWLQLQTCSEYMVGKCAYKTFLKSNTRLDIPK